MGSNESTRKVGAHVAEMAPLIPSGNPSIIGGIANPKSEGRNPKESRIPKSEKSAARGSACFAEPTPTVGVRISSIGFLSDFGFRVSDLGVPQTPDFSEALFRSFIFPCQNPAGGLDSDHLEKQERPAWL